MTSALSLPQPPSIVGQCEADQRHHPYKYVTYDVLETDWLGDPQRLQSFVNGDDVTNITNTLDDSNARYAPGTLVWVLLSKGKPKEPKLANSQSGYNDVALHRKRRDKKNKRKSPDTSGNNDDNNDNEGSGNNDGSKKEAAGGDKNIQNDDGSPNIQNDDNEKNNTNTDTTTTTHQKTTLNQSRKEFFSRARVISDDEAISSEGGDEKRIGRRIVVRYSRGATYRVRAYNLIPVLEPSVQSPSLPPMVVLVPETNIYRREAKVHTTPNDSFMELGCDYGITVDKIQKSLQEAGDVPKVWPPIDVDENAADGEGASPNSENRVSCLGVDKSRESIKLAKERYPKCLFSLGNILFGGMTSIRTLCEKSLVGSAPSIICIDVNGNRDIDGVLKCLEMVMNEPWKRQPRMIIVKSRFLYWELKKMEKDDTNGSAILSTSALGS